MRHSGHPEFLEIVCDFVHDVFLWIDKIVICGLLQKLFFAADVSVLGRREQGGLRLTGTGALAFHKRAYEAIAAASVPQGGLTGRAEEDWVGATLKAEQAVDTQLVGFGPVHIPRSSAALRFDTPSFFRRSNCLILLMSFVFPAIYVMCFWLLFLTHKTTERAESDRICSVFLPFLYLL